MENKSSISLVVTIILVALFAQNLIFGQRYRLGQGTTRPVPKKTRWHPLVRYSNFPTVQYSNGIQILVTILCPTSLWPFEYRTILICRSPQCLKTRLVLHKPVWYLIVLDAILYYSFVNSDIFYIEVWVINKKLFSDRSYPRDHDTRAVAQVQGSSAKDTISQIHDFPRRPGKEEIWITNSSLNGRIGPLRCPLF